VRYLFTAAYLILSGVFLASSPHRRRLFFGLVFSSPRSDRC
jgi:hypothetical protein